MKYEERTQVTRIKRRLRPAIRPLVAIITAFLITAITAQNLLPGIANQRGYFAIGGEIFLLIGILYASYMAVMALLEMQGE